MVKLFSPAIALMNRLKYPQKFLLVALVVLIPLTILLSQYLSAVNHDISFAADERLGLIYNEPVFDFLALAQQQAIYAAAAVSGDPSFRALLLDSEVQLDAQIERIDAVNDRYGRALGVSDLWESIKADWNENHVAAASGDAEAAILSVAEFSRLLRDLITVVGNNSNLILDPDIDSYYLMDTVINKLPQTTDYFTQLSYVMVRSAVTGSVTDEDSERVELLSGLVATTLTQTQNGFDYAYGVNDGLVGQLRPNEDAVYAQSAQAIELLHAAAVRGELETPGTTVSLSLEALHAQFRLYDDVSAALDLLLASRINSFAAQRNAVLAVTAVALALATYLLSAFYLAVRKTINNLSATTERMIKGHTGQAFTPDSRDELAEVVSSFAQIADEMVTARNRALQANRVKSEFLANVSHELRTPLNAIIGFSDMLLAGMVGEITEKQHHKLTRLRENGHRLLSLINDLLDLTRIEAGRMELVHARFQTRPLIERLSHQMEVLAQQKGLDFNVNVDEGLPESVIGDEKRLEQIIINLLSNAFKFTPKGEVNLNVRANAQNKTWQIAVSDTGVGIPPHALNLIF